MDLAYSLVDDAMGVECVSEWLPDFLAWAENPHHPDAPALMKRGVAAVRESFEQSYPAYSDDIEPGEVLVARETTITLLIGFAEWTTARQARPGGDS